MSDRFRVRDRNTTKGLGTVWGENLTYAEAHTLKEMVCGTRKSTTARVEPMNVPVVPPPPLKSPVLASAQAKAAAAASSIAAEAQRRADAYQAKQKAAAIVASLPKVEDFDDGDLDELQGAPGDIVLDDLLDGVDVSPPKSAP